MGEAPYAVSLTVTVQSELEDDQKQEVEEALRVVLQSDGLNTDADGYAITMELQDTTTEGAEYLVTVSGAAYGTQTSVGDDVRAFFNDGYTDVNNQLDLPPVVSIGEPLYEQITDNGDGDDDDDDDDDDANDAGSESGGGDGNNMTFAIGGTGLLIVGAASIIACRRKNKKKNSIDPDAVSAGVEMHGVAPSQKMQRFNSDVSGDSSAFGFEGEGVLSGRSSQGIVSGGRMRDSTDSVNSGAEAFWGTAAPSANVDMELEAALEDAFDLLDSGDSGMETTTPSGYTYQAGDVNQKAAGGPERAFS